MFNIRGLAIRAYNAAHQYFWPCAKPIPDNLELREIEARAARSQTDISDHLSAIFCETVAAQPRLIVELGVRTGESRFVLEKAARTTGAFLLSVDLDDCSAACNQSPSLHFVKADDVEFHNVFPQWCSQHAIEPSIDVLFVDTSHLYEHTVQEIRAWFPYLSSKCKVIFHDTNLGRFIRRRDGTIDWSWDNQRGVIRAIEEHLGTRFDERADFVTIVDDWLIRHWSHCNGLTILERMPEALAGRNRKNSSEQVAVASRANGDGDKDFRPSGKM